MKKVQQLYFMEQPDKKTNSTFLQKFKGRTSKIDKSGISHALASDKGLGMMKEKEQSVKHRPRKLTGLDSRNLSQDYGIKDIEMNNLPMGSPQRRPLLPSLSKRGTNSNILTNKLGEVPLLYSPLVPLKQIKQPLPPSRSTSDRSQNLHRRSFGKYLKLDDDAMRHFQFLLQIDKGKGRKSSMVGVS